MTKNKTNLLVNTLSANKFLFTFYFLFIETYIIYLNLFYIQIYFSSFFWIITSYLVTWSFLSYLIPYPYSWKRIKKCCYLLWTYIVLLERKIVPSHVAVTLLPITQMVVWLHFKRNGKILLYTWLMTHFLKITGKLILPKS